MDKNPGPGEYGAPSVFDTHTKGFSIMSRHPDNNEYA